MNTLRPRRHITLRTIGLVAIIAISLPLGACKITEQQQGNTGLVTRFNGTVLKADLPMSVGVAKTIEASRKVLENRYFVIVDSTIGAERGFVTGRPPRTVDFPRVKITAENAVTADGQPVTRLVIAFQPVGDEFSSRDIMGQILTELGL